MAEEPTPLYYITNALITLSPWLRVVCEISLELPSPSAGALMSLEKCATLAAAGWRTPSHRTSSRLFVGVYPKKSEDILPFTVFANSQFSSFMNNGRVFHSHANNLSWFHFDSVFTWEKPQTRHIQPAWKTAPGMTIDTHYSSAKLDGVREITPCIKRALFTWGEDEIIQGLLFTYDDGTRTCICEVLYDDLGTPQKVTSDTLWMRYVGYKEAGLSDENIHCCDCGIAWFGFSRPLLQSFSSHREMDNLTDEQDSDEEQTSYEADSSAENDSEDEAESDDEYDRFPKYISLPMRGRLDWVKDSDGSTCLLSHHMRRRPDNEMLHVLAEDAKSEREDPVVKSCTILTGEITPRNLRDTEQVAEEFDNYNIYRL